MKGRSSVVAAALASLLLAGSAMASTSYTVSVSMDGPSEVPTNASTATGSGTLTITYDANLPDTITYSITHNVVGPNNAHIHGPAARDKATGVLIGFPSFTSPMNGTLFITTAAQKSAILSGSSYVNIHSGTFPGGEIRGQVPAEPGEVPSVNEWGMILLALALVGLGSFLVIRQRRALA